jgi:P-type Ca2+ transporter type 2C
MTGLPCASGASVAPNPDSRDELRPDLHQGAAHWAELNVDAVFAELGSSCSGLSNREAATRLAHFGPNMLPAAARRQWYVELGANFVHMFALLLWSGAILAWIAGMPELAWAIVAVIVINGLFSYWQEYQAERAAEALQALLPHSVRVRRGGQEQVLSAVEIVPGDVLILEEGEAIPADGRVSAAHRLRVDTSSLTGESRPIPRTADVTDSAGRPGAMLPNLVLAGTAVASGRGEAVVYASGARTEFGRLASLTQVLKERPSPLEIEIHKITRLVTVLALAMGIVCFGAGIGVGGLSAVAGFLFAVGIIVANVPEGLLPTMTLALALGVRRMAARNALVKRLSAVEALGATTVILADKTGTLTENEMTVRELWVAGVSYRVSGAGYDADGKLESTLAGDDLTTPLELVRAAALCCDARLIAASGARRHWQVIGDPTEAAILVAAAKLGLTPDALAAWPRLAELPFDSVRKRMTSIQRIDGAAVACVKGAPSEVLPRCTRMRWLGATVPFDGPRQQAVQTAHDVMAQRGLRVLAIAVRPVEPTLQSGDGWRAEDVECGLTLLGLLAMEDPPRPEVPAALAACRQAGIRVIMITGDSGLTAASIGREIGLHDTQPKVIHGTELESMDDRALDALLDVSELLFARVSPEHKLRLVEAFQRRGAVVAVTGDGVNDAPALKRADIGVAMGATGTDVAREASDMVLADDNFASIVAAIEEGRAVYDNIRKFITYIFASNIPEVVPFIAFVLFRIPLPLTVMQILAVDLGTDLLPALALGMERPESDVMQRHPRPRTERLLNRATLLRAYGWLGPLEAGFGLAGYFFAFWWGGWQPGDPLPRSGVTYLTATTMSLAGIVACQVGNVFACRSDRESIVKLGFGTNRTLLAGIVVELIVLLLLVYNPPLEGIFGLAPLGFAHWVLLVTFGPLLLLLEEIRKAARRGSRRHSMNETTSAPAKANNVSFWRSHTSP